VGLGSDDCGVFAMLLGLSLTVGEAILVRVDLGSCFLLGGFFAFCNSLTRVKGRVGDIRSELHLSILLAGIDPHKQLSLRLVADAYLATVMTTMPVLLLHLLFNLSRCHFEAFLLQALALLIRLSAAIVEV
jgi:hypothetical protein